MLVGARRRTRRSRCSRRRRRPAAATPRPGSPPRGTRPGPPRRRRRTPPPRAPSARSWAAVAAPTAMGRPAATIPFAPKMPRSGSAMCIEPPRPRLVPCVPGHQLGEHPERVQALGQAVAVAPVGRGDDVRRARAASTRRPPTPPGRPTGGRTRAPRRPGRARPPAARSPGSPASAGASRAGRRASSHGRMYCTGRYKTGRGMSEQIEIPRSLPAWRRRPGQAGGPHRRRPGPRPAARPRVLPGRRAGSRSSPAPRPT